MAGDLSLSQDILEGVAHASGDNGSRPPDDWSVLAITLDRKEVPVGILEPGDFAAAGAGRAPSLVGSVIKPLSSTPSYCSKVTPFEVSSQRCATRIQLPRFPVEA
jgi:hypothetical protein